MANKFFAKKVWIVPGNEHMFRSEHDAKYYCEKNDIDFSLVEKYDSTKEYYRWLELQELERQGKISDLKRQVKFVLTPKQYRREKKGEREKKRYLIPEEGIGGGCCFDRKKDAVAYAKSKGMSAKWVTTTTNIVPVYKDKMILDEMKYFADFTYIEDGEFIIEDCKSDYTAKEQTFIDKMKWIYYKYRILIRIT